VRRKVLVAALEIVIVAMERYDEKERDEY